MHSTNSQCPCLSSNLNSTTSHSSHGSPSLSCHCVSNHKPKQSMPFPIRSVQIEASPDETNNTNMLHDILREKPKSLASIGSRMRLHAWTQALAHPPTCHNRFLTRKTAFGHTCHYVGLFVFYSMELENLALIRHHMHPHAPPSFWSHLHAPEVSVMHHKRVEKRSEDKTNII